MKYLIIGLNFLVENPQDPWKIDFPADSVFTFDVCWSSLGTSIFGNSSSATNNTWCRLPSRLSFRSDDYEITMMTRQNDPIFFICSSSSIHWLFHFCISRPSKFSFVESSSCIMFWSVKYIFTCKRWDFQAF